MTGSEKQISEKRNVLLVCSSGGHLAQLLELEFWWKDHNVRWVTFDLPDARSRLGEGEFVAAHYPTTRNVKNTLKNLWLAKQVIDDFKPDVVISNGAAVAVPFFVEAKRRKVPSVFIEVYDRVDSRTLTGKLARPMVTSFLVQWPEQKELYEGSTLIGPLYS